MSRREQLRSMLAEQPQDTFLRYALAMELKNEGAFEESTSLFQSLTADSTPYVPAFFMWGQQLVETDQLDAAQEVLRKGIDQATQQKDLHAAGEMSEFLASLE